jgi:phosphatidate phosphatase APP1
VDADRDAVSALHRAARAEDAFKAAAGSMLRRRGWQPQVVPYTGYGGPGWVRVLARVLLARAPDPDLSVREQSERVVRGWRSFLTAPVARAAVQVDVGTRRSTVSADRGGYVDAVVESDLAPGWHDVRLTVEGHEAVPARVVVVGREQRYGVVSDIDDTVMVTSLPRPLIAAWNTFVLHEQARYVVPGMAPLYREIVVRHPGTPVFYLSTGAWNVAPTLARFLARHGYPDGPMLLTDWGPTNTGWFRSGREHKRAALRRLRHEFPQVRWLLVGDDGQHDPDIYGEFAEELPEAVRGVAIRQLSVSQQVLAHGAPVPLPDAEHTPQSAVPEVRGPDGTRLGDELRAAGLL